MKSHTRPLLLMHADSQFEVRLRDAVGRDFALRKLASWAALRAELRQVSPAALVVVDPYFGSMPRGMLAPELQALLSELPSMVVLAALEVRLSGFADLRTLGEWGIAEVISLAEDNAQALARVLRSLRGRQVQSVVTRALPAYVPARARSILEIAGDVASVGGHATDLARALHVSMRTLLRWCSDGSLPPPRHLLAWMRILLAAELMEDPGRSLESVALACGYAADSGLRRALRDFLDTNPKTLRRGGAFTTASTAFRDALDKARNAAPAAYQPRDPGMARVAAPSAHRDRNGHVEVDR
jgi:AraC-like DNA-binding protein